MKKIIGILGVLAISLGCNKNVAFAADVKPSLQYEEVSNLEKAEITSETSVRLVEDGTFYSNQKNEIVRLTNLESRALDDIQIIANDIASNTRATGSITWEIPAGATGKGKTPFPLEVGESVTINCSYSPRSADVDFGLIAPNGRFYYTAGENGSINQTIDIDMRGEYYLAICNNSSYTVSVYGFINY